MTYKNPIPLLIAVLMSAIVAPSNSAAEPADWKVITPKWDGGSEKSIGKLACWPKKDEIVATAGSGLWFSKDGGEMWQRYNKPDPTPTSAKFAPSANCLVFDPKNGDTLWTSGMYGYGAWTTTDGGKTFTQLGKVNHFDCYAVDFSDPERKTQLVCQHEQKHSLLKSTDAGATWVKLEAEGPCGSSIPSVLDSRTFLVNSVVYGTPTQWGIYRSDDAGQTWTKVSDEQAGSCTPTITSGGDIFWGGDLKSADRGKTWTRLKSPVKGQVVEVAPGRLVGLGNRGGKSQLYVSKDAGNTWTPFGKLIPFKARAFAFNAARKCFLVAEERPKGQTGGVLARWDLPGNMEEAFAP